MSPKTRRVVTLLAWLVVVAPAIYQLSLLATAIGGRISYPYDLEWMEGGMLHHAERIRDGQGIYVMPSMDFIPYLYTPLYPALLAGLDSVFGLGIGYTAGRAVSVLSLLGIGAVGYTSLVGPARRGAKHLVAPSVVGAALAFGVFAAGYPYVEGWYDLVRADTLALLMITGAIAGAARWATRGHAQVAAVGVLLALAFFTKQTSIIYVAWAGLIIGVLSLRQALSERKLRPLARPFTFAAAAGVVGLGGAALLQQATGGWFWTYAFEVHQAHDFNMDRFWKSFGNVLWHWPALTIIIVATALIVIVTTISRRRLPVTARPFVLWTLTYALSTFVGAVGWGTEFAHFNAYMPALLHGGFAVGAAVPAIAGCVEVWRHPAGESRPSLAPQLVALVPALIIGAVLVNAHWQPRKFMPTNADRVAGDKLIATIAAIDGDVWIPYHPWYARLAGKAPHVHRMGLRDVTARSKFKVPGADEAARDRRFAAIVFDNRKPFDDLPDFARTYRPELAFTPGRPRVFTGASVFPETLWVSNQPSPLPPGMKSLFDFETLSWAGWEIRGKAWGRGPTTRAQTGQGQPVGYDGSAFATSMWGGDKSTGTALSPGFVLDGSVMMLRLAGGNDARTLRVELRIDNRAVLVGSVDGAASEVFRQLRWDVSQWRGKTAILVLIDDNTGSWGHLDVDEVLLGDPR